MKRESSIFGHFWLFQGIIYLTIYIFLGSIFCSTLQTRCGHFFDTAFPGHRRIFQHSFSFSFSLQWIQLTLGHVEIREPFGRGLADSAGWLRSESHGLAPRRHGLEDHQGLGLKVEPPAPQG